MLENETKMFREPATVLFHLNGYTKIVLERFKGLGLCDGRVEWDIPTELIPVHLRRIGSRFIIEAASLSSEEAGNIAFIRSAKNRFKFFELSDTQG